MVLSSYSFDEIEFAFDEDGVPGVESTHRLGKSKYKNFFNDSDLSKNKKWWPVKDLKGLYQASNIKLAFEGDYLRIRNLKVEYNGNIFSNVNFQIQSENQLNYWSSLKKDNSLRILRGKINRVGEVKIVNSIILDVYANNLLEKSEEIEMVLEYSPAER